MVLTITGTSSLSSVTSCGSYVWNGVTYTSSGTYYFSSGSCTDTLVLTINNTSTSSSTVSACDSYTWNGVTYTSSGTYTWSGTNSVGCDSTATLNLTINNAQFNSVSISSCDTIHGMELPTQHQVFIHGQVLMLMDVTVQFS